MGKLVWMIKWVLVLILVWTIGWAVSVSRQAGPVLGPATAMALDDRGAEIKASTIPAQPPVQEGNCTAILQHDLFGGMEATAPQRSEINEHASPSIGEALGIALAGTVSGNPHVARAVIRDTRTKIFTVYKIGDRLGDATLEGISRDAVVFRHQGQLKVLRRSEAKTAQSQDQASISPANPAGPVASVAAQHQTAAQAQPDTGYVRQLLEKATITPVSADGQMQGLKITGLDQIPAARQLGLEEGDVICAVNGQGLTDPRKAFQIFKKARSQETLQVELLRKGQAKTLSFDLR